MAYTPFVRAFVSKLRDFANMHKPKTPGPASSAAVTGHFKGQRVFGLCSIGALISVAFFRQSRPLLSNKSTHSEYSLLGRLVVRRLGYPR